MNWFSKLELKTILESIPKQMTKYASGCGENWDNQEGDWLMFGNVNRYALDAYAIKVFLSRTETAWTISLMTNHAYLGTAQYNVFWRYNKDEEKRARKTFKALNKIVKETVEDFINRERPSSMFDSVLRNKIQSLDENDLVHTNIPCVNYSYNIEYSGEWDKNIYGPRYPHSNRDQSFAQYTNSSYFNDKNRIKGKYSM